MNTKILIVEDEFIVANDLEMMLKRAGYEVCGIAESYQEAMNLIDKEQPSWVLLDIFIKGDLNGIDIATQLNKRHIGFIYISANSNQRILEMARATEPYGFLVKPFREKDLMIMLDIAQYRHEQSLNIGMMRRDLLQQKIEQLMQSNQKGEQLLVEILCALHAVLPFDVLNLKLDRGKISSPYEFTIVLTEQKEYQPYHLDNLLEHMGLDAGDYRKLNFTVQHCKEKRILNGNAFRRQLLDLPWLKTFSNHFNLGSVIQIPLSPNPDHQYQLSLYSKEKDGYFNIHLETLDLLDSLLNRALEMALHVKIERPIVKATEVIAPLTEAKTTNKSLKTSEIEGIIGKSASLQVVLNQLNLVATADATVLIYGESGTGKERIAKSIHQLSNRKSKPLIVVNCAALPVNLIESELFGHEKGAFTGANEKRIGKFEQADGGTIFLDEIGELPLELQVKLLRVLQEREIEKIGSNKTVKVDVRVITATNRILEKEVAEGRFRLDLYYRLNVFPITLPPLRNRKEDIPDLVSHFLNRFSVNAKIPAVSTQALLKLQQYHWPGNIRELEHLIERTVILNNGNDIKNIELPIAYQSNNPSMSKNMPLLTMEEMERRYILSVLQSCNGKVSGHGGAAEILGLPTSTLNSKIQKLGIKKEGTSFGTTNDK